METFQKNSINFIFIITCIIVHLIAQSHCSHVHRVVGIESEMGHVPTSESPAESPDPTGDNVSPSPHFSLESPPIPSRTICQTDINPWDAVTSSFSDDQILKKALEVHISRQGIEKTKELIAMTTGLVFAPETAESMNSVLPADSMVQVAPSVEPVVKIQPVDPATNQRMIVASASPYAEMLRGAINAYSDQVHSGGVDLVGSRSSSGELVNDPVTPEPPADAAAVIVYDRVSPFNHADSNPERFLIIPGRRQRPFGTKVRVMVRNRVREVKITSSPRMSVYDALKQAEKKIQFVYPELTGQRVIHMERRMMESKDGIRDCSMITRVGRVEEDEANTWFVRVSYSPGTQIVYEGRCVPSEREVHVRPATTIDLIYTPVAASASDSIS